MVQLTTGGAPWAWLLKASLKLCYWSCYVVLYYCVYSADKEQVEPLLVRQITLETVVNS